MKNIFIYEKAPYAIQKIKNYRLLTNQTLNKTPKILQIFKLKENTSLDVSIEIKHLILNKLYD